MIKRVTIREKDGSVTEAYVTETGFHDYFVETRDGKQAFTVGVDGTVTKIDLGTSTVLDGTTWEWA